MFGNYRELPQGYIVRRIRNSDIFDVIKFLRNEFSNQRDESSTQIISLIITLIAFVGIFILLSFINGSFIIGFIYTLLALIILVLATFTLTVISPYFYWSHMIDSGECLLIIHQYKIRAVIATLNFNNYSYIRLLFVSHSYRRRGLGTYLINRIRDNLNNPIYLCCLPEPYLVEFYSSNGFVAIEENQLPRRIIKSKGKQTMSPLIPMILEENLEA